MCSGVSPTMVFLSMNVSLVHLLCMTYFNLIDKY